MVLQTIVQALLESIEANTAFTGKGIAVPSVGGYNLLLFGEQAGGEFERVQVDDRLGEFFYVRLLSSQVEVGKPKGRLRGSCSSANISTARCRLVGMSHCMPAGELAGLFEQQVASFRQRNFGGEFYDAKTAVKATLYDFAAIVREEVPEDERAELSGWPGNMQVVAINFDLSFTTEACNEPSAVSNC